MYQLDFTEKAMADIDFFKKAGNTIIIKKIAVLLKEISLHPFTGTAKPEALKHNLIGKWSRRINKEHRLVYEVLEKIIIIHSLKGHY